MEVGGVEAGGVAGVVDHRPADSATRVVFAHLDGVGAPDNPFLIPVQLVRSGLVGDPVLVGMPERASFDDHDPPAGPGQTLGQDGTSGPGADDADVDLLSYRRSGTWCPRRVDPGGARRAGSANRCLWVRLPPLSRSRITRPAPT